MDDQLSKPFLTRSEWPWRRVKRSTPTSHLATNACDRPAHAPGVRYRSDEAAQGEVLARRLYASLANSLPSHTGGGFKGAPGVGVLPCEAAQAEAIGDGPVVRTAPQQQRARVVGAAGAVARDELAVRLAGPLRPRHLIYQRRVQLRKANWWFGT